MNCSNFCSHSSSPQNLHEYVRTGIFTTKTSVGKNSTVVVATYNGTKGAITLFTIHDFSSDQDGKGSSRSASAIPRGRIASKTRVCEAACPTDIRGPALTCCKPQSPRGSTEDRALRSRFRVYADALGLALRSSYTHVVAIAAEGVCEPIPNQ